MIARLRPEIELRVPPRSLLGKKKQPAPGDRLWCWLRENIAETHRAILSIEMLVYGGLLPSRLHHDSVETLLERLDRLRQLKVEQPSLQILASNLIMRTPAYASSEEEPDYYARWGDRIFRYGWLLDKRTRAVQGREPALTPAETEEFERIRAELPPEYLSDYRQRRAKNLEVNQAALRLVEDGTIDFLSIPQDDSAPYGFTALDQQPMIQQIAQKRLQHRVLLYPGADEVGCTLLARACVRTDSQSIRFYPIYSSSSGEQRVPLYEDRPLGESLRAHLQAAGAHLAHSPAEADIILAINTPGKVMQEAWDQPIKDLSYTTHRNLNFFVAQIEQFLAGGQAVAIADVAFANGGETALVELLDDAALWDDVLAYAGWNTSCNTLGTVLAISMLAVKPPAQTVHSQASPQRSEGIALNKIYHLLEDWAYQSEVRMPMVQDFLPGVNATYYDFAGREAEVHAEMERRIRQLWQHTLRQSFQTWSIQSLEVFTPWNRMFEIELLLSISSSSEEPSKKGTGSRPFPSQLPGQLPGQF